MKIETLKDRIVNTGLKLEKIEGTLARHKARLLKKSNILTTAGIDLTNYNKYDRNSVSEENYYYLCDYEYALEDIENTNKKINQTVATLIKLQEQLKNQLAKEAETDNLIPEVLNTFLENWKQKCIEFYTVLANEYIELQAIDYKSYEITEDYLKQAKETHYNFGQNRRITTPKYSDTEIQEILNGNIAECAKRQIQREIRYETIKKFIDRHFASDMDVISKIIDNMTINNVMLNKILDEDVKIKKEMFINRIKQVIGEIKDLSGLRVSSTGDINGIAIGVKCNAKVETITAGGYNIQCWHYRVLINIVK